ncbi:hypothetical protein ALC57_10673, partial [Trachymyrmex cornetzi]
ATKCGYCGFVMKGSCGTILDHHCFATYHENADFINVDQNAIVTMNVQKQTEIRKKFLNMIDEELSQKKRDTVDSYLEQLGDILRRLPYIRRRNLQRKILDIVIEEEDDFINIINF